MGKISEWLDKIFGQKNSDKQQDQDAEYRYFYGQKVDANGFTLGNMNQDIYQEYLALEHKGTLEYHSVDEPVKMTDPSNIHEIRLSNDDISSPERFWGQHNRNIDDYIALAKDIPVVRERLDQGESFESLYRDPKLSACTRLYFDPQRAVRVREYKGTYMLGSDGRHRIIAAQLVGGEVPIRVVGKHVPKIEPKEINPVPPEQPEPPKVEQKKSRLSFQTYQDLTPEERAEIQEKQQAIAERYRKENNLDEHGQPIDRVPRPSGGVERECERGGEDPRWYAYDIDKPHPSKNPEQVKSDSPKLELELTKTQDSGQEKSNRSIEPEESDQLEEIENLKDSENNNDLDADDSDGINSRELTFDDAEDDVAAAETIDADDIDDLGELEDTSVSDADENTFGDAEDDDVNEIETTGFGDFDDSTDSEDTGVSDVDEDAFGDAEDNNIDSNIDSRDDDGNIM